jgi:hypothetical protein
MSASGVRRAKAALEELFPLMAKNLLHFRRDFQFADHF